MPTAMPGSTNCSSAVGLSRLAAGRMCGANSSMSTPPPAHRSPKKRSTASASSTQSRTPSTDHLPSGDGSSASSTQSRLPRHLFLLQVVGTDLVGSARHNLLGGEDGGLNEAADWVGVNP